MVKYNNKIIISLFLSLLLIWSGFYLSYPNIFESRKKFEQLAKQKISEQKGINKALAFGHLNLAAKAFAVYDIETGELIAGRQEQRVLPLASITKVMTVLVASDELKSKTPIVVNGEKWSLANLAALTLVGSSNDGATALAGQGNFINLMNEKSRAFGLNDLYFTNPTGLDDESAPGGRGSALSVAKLFAYLIKNKPELLSATCKPIIEEKSLDNLNHIVLNTNDIVNDIPGLLASKTGYTDLAGGNLAIVANLGLRRPVAIVVLGSSEKGRFTDTKNLVEATLNYYSNFTPPDDGASK